MYAACSPWTIGAFLRGSTRSTSAPQCKPPLSWIARTPCVAQSTSRSWLVVSSCSARSCLLGASSTTGRGSKVILMTSGPTQGHTCTFSIRSRLPITAFRLSHKSAVASVGNSHHHRKWQTLIASMVIDLRVQPATTVGGKRSSDTTTIDDHRIPRPSTVIVIRCGCAHRRSSTCVSTTIVSGNAHPSTVIDLRGQPTITASGKRQSRPSTVIDLREHNDRSSAATIIDFRLSISELLVGYLHHIDGTKKKQPTRV